MELQSRNSQEISNEARKQPDLSKGIGESKHVELLDNGEKSTKAFIQPYLNESTETDVISPVHDHRSTKNGLEKINSCKHNLILKK